MGMWTIIILGVATFGIIAGGILIVVGWDILTNGFRRW